MMETAGMSASTHRTGSPRPVIGSATDLLGRFLQSFGEEHRKNLGELALSPEHSMSASKMVKEYPRLVDDLSKLLDRQPPAPEAPLLDDLLLTRLWDHLDECKRIVVKLMSSNRNLSRPFWPVMREQCTYMQMVIGELRKLAGTNAIELPEIAEAETLAVVGPRPSLDFLLVTEKVSSLDRSRYDIDLTHMEKCAGASLTKTTGALEGPSRYKTVTRPGYVYVEEFRNFAGPFRVMTEALNRSLTGSRVRYLPELFVDDVPGDLSKGGGRILFSLLLRNAAAYLVLTAGLSRDLDHLQATQALFHPGCRYLKEIHVALDFAATHHLCDGKMFTEEVLLARRTCIDLLKSLGRLISEAEIKVG